MAISEDEEQPPHLNLPATVQQRRQHFRPQRRQALEYHVEVVEAFMVGQLIDSFEDCPFGRRHPELPVPRKGLPGIRGIIGKAQLRIVKEGPAVRLDRRVQRQLRKPVRYDFTIDPYRGVTAQPQVVAVTLLGERVMPPTWTS